MRVDHRRAYVLVAKQFLDRANVVPISQEVRGEEVGWALPGLINLLEFTERIGIGDLGVFCSIIAISFRFGNWWRMQGCFKQQMERCTSLV